MTNSTDKIKLNELVGDGAEKFEVAQAVNFKKLVKQAQLEAQSSQLQNQNTIYFNKLCINGREFTLRRLDWRDLIDGNFLEDALIGVFGYPWYLFKKDIIWTVFNFLQYLFGLYRSAFNASHIILNHF